MTRIYNISFKYPFMSIFFLIPLAQVTLPSTSSQQRNHHVGVELSRRSVRVPTPTLVGKGACSLVGAFSNSAVLLDAEPHIDEERTHEGATKPCYNSEGCRW